MKNNLEDFVIIFFHVIQAFIKQDIFLLIHVQGEVTFRVCFSEYSLKSQDPLNCSS